MRRTAMLLLLVGLLPFVLPSPYFELDHQYSTTVHPCQDFHKFVCNPEVNGNESFTFQLRSKFQNEIVSSLLNYSDPVIDFLREIFLRDMKNKTLFGEGFKNGEAAAKGDDSYAIEADVTTSSLQIFDRNTVGKAGDIIKSIECAYSDCPAFVKGIVAGFKKIVDHSDRIDLRKWKIVAKYIEIKAPEVTEEQKMEAHRLVFTAFGKKSVTPYLNLLMAKVATEKSLWIPKHMEEELKHIGDVLIEETAAQLQKQAWIPEDRKTKAIQLMKAIKKVLVLDEATKDLGNIEKALDFFIAQFEKNNGNLVAEMEKESCNVNCLMELTSLAIHQAMHSYNLNFHDSDHFVDFFTHSNSQGALFTVNAFTLYNKMLIHPAMQFYMKEDLPGTW